MSSIYTDIKNLFYSRNELVRIILLISCIYLFLLISRVLFTLLNIPDPINHFVQAYLLVPAYWYSALTKPWTILTHMFIHVSIFHVFFNMLALYWFGGIYSEYLGIKKLTYTFVLGGIFGAIIYIISYNIFPYFSDVVLFSKGLGASAGVMAIVFATATLLPDYSIVLAIFGAVRLKYIALIYLVLDLIGITGNNSGGHIAHIGGALFGFILIKQLQRGNDFIKNISNIGGIFTRKKKMKIVHTQTTKSNKQEEIDKILDKISASGYDKLSAKEKEQLFNYSKENEKK